MEKTVYKDKFLTIKERQVVVRGKSITMHSYLQEDVVVIIPLLKNGNLLMERQFRHGVDAYVLEFPAGLIEKGERRSFSAKRELEEETGYKARRIKYLFSEFSSVATSKRMFHYFFASNLERGKKKFDDTEIIETLELSPSRLMKMIAQNKIKDHKTITGILYYNNFIKKG
ncbi:MAG: NUDIX hydrolase [Candidatus Micrarchaeota archaeon]|nr:NUDIX hydrolase [Candidatus Micrarchaeota archaeon]